MTDEDQSEVGAAAPSHRTTSGSVKGGSAAAGSGGVPEDEMNCSASVLSLSDARINPPLPSRRGAAPFRGAGSAFTSYVRRRGEPDGGGNEAQDMRSHYTNQIAVQSVLSPALECNPMNNSADSDFSDSCYATTLLTQAPVLKTGRKMVLSNGTFAGLRGPVKVSRPGGGTESDAAFTPSPPVTNQQQLNTDSNVSLALAHQTRIRNLYSGGHHTAGDAPGGGGKVMDRKSAGRRPDSSSSASSATDWEGSGHATVLRRGLGGVGNGHQLPQPHQQQPPMPQPRHKLPLVDSLRPLMPVYNNMSNLTAALGDILNSALDQSTSSDSEFERGFEMIKLRSGPPGGKKTQTGSSSSIAGRKMNAPLMDRLSVRSENASASLMMTTSLMNPSNGASRKLPVVTDQDEGSSSGISSSGTLKQQKLYLSANEALLECFADCAPSGSNSSGIGEGSMAAAVAGSKKDSAKTLNKEQGKNHHHHYHQQSLQLPTGQSNGMGATAPGPSHLHQKGESMAMRQMNREMTPTISDVYHERNLGLGLAPSLSKLLLSKNYHEEMSEMKGGNAGSSSSSSMKSTSTMIDSVNVNDLDVSAVTQQTTNNASTTEQLCPMCKGTEAVCTCNKIMTMATMVVTTGPGLGDVRAPPPIMKKPTSKPWLSNVNTNLVNASDLTTADILERQKFKATTPAIKSGRIPGEDEITVESSSIGKGGNESPQFSELSRRDEGDGRSVADSNCSGSFKIDQQQTQANSNSGSGTNKAGAANGKLLSNAINVQK